MNARCQELRDRTSLLEGGGGQLADELRSHLGGCEACAAWLARHTTSVALLSGLERQRAPAELDHRVAQQFTAESRERRALEALRALPRLSAPMELDGRVVAAGHAGYREDRAAAWLSAGLAPLRAPAELEWRVAAELDQARGEGAAPAELGSRLTQDLGDLEGALAARYATRMTPLGAPEALEGRVREMLERVGRQRRRALALTACLAVSALALLGWRGARPPAGEAAPALVRLERPGLDFEVQLVHPGALDLSPVVRARAGGVTSGLSDVLSAAPQRSTPGLDAWARQSMGSVGAPRPPLEAPRAARTPTAPGEGDSYPSSGGGSTSPSFGDLASQPFLEKLALAPFSVRHEGRRRVLVRDPSSATSLELVEDVWSDGDGRFAVRLHAGGPDDEMFELMHNDREGFIQRYRDFRVRDLASFLEGFEVDVLDADDKIAGRRVVMLEIVRRVEPERRYTVGVDPLTGLVLSYEERQGPKNELVAAVEYESLDLDPDLRSVDLSGGPSRWLEFDPEDAPRALTGMLVRPAYTPRHHHLERAASIKDALGNTWIEFVYGDGVEQVFFLHGEPRAKDPDVGSTGPRDSDAVRVSRVGAWTILVGEVHGTPVAALGKVDLDEILLLVQSAFGG